jgi:hypothetical protein
VGHDHPSELLNAVRMLHSIISLIMHHVLPWFDFGVRVC